MKMVIMATRLKSVRKNHLKKSRIAPCVVSSFGLSIFLPKAFFGLLLGSYWASKLPLGQSIANPLCVHKEMDLLCKTRLAFTWAMAS
jgi:hypothetical protein